MDDERKSDSQISSGMVKKEVPPLQVTAITTMINTLFKDARPTITGRTQIATLHDILNEFYLPDPDTTAKWIVREIGDNLEMEAVDDKGIVLVKGKATKYARPGFTDEKIPFAWTGGQPMTMELDRYEQNSSAPTRLKLNAQNPQTITIAGRVSTKPAIAGLTYARQFPFAMIQYRT